MSRLLNLGCGERFHPDWENVDLAASHPLVRAHDLRRGIPFPDLGFDAVYHSHVLEHFPRDRAAGFMRECFRVLKPGGIIRVAVPDLEQIARLYLEMLERAKQGAPEDQANYEWMMLELLDQTVRERPGGSMKAHLCQPAIPNLAFIKQRIGAEAERILAAGAARPSTAAAAAPPPKAGWGARLRRAWKQPRAVLGERLVRWLLGEEYALLQLGRFRHGGEIHEWMYDVHSLARLMADAGFQAPRPVGPGTSDIPGWPAYHLDTEPDGSVCKPDSLYMEARKA